MQNEEQKFAETEKFVTLGVWNHQRELENIANLKISSEDNLIGEISRHLICSICLDILEEPIQCKDCTNLFCSKEADNIEFCPKCKHQPFNLGNAPLLAKESIEKLQFKCPNCKDFVPYQSRHTHKQNCEALLLKCPTFCGKKRLNSEIDLRDHLTNDCQKRQRQEVISSLAMKTPTKEECEIAQDQKYFKGLEEKVKEFGSLKSIEMFLKNKHLLKFGYKPDWYRSEKLKFHSWTKNNDGNGFSQGQFNKKGHQNGKMVQITIRGDICFGFSQQGDLQGNGVQIWASGNIYVGYIKQGKRSMNGILKFENGNKYEGEWINDLKHGEGIMTYQNGNKYEGNWEQSKRQGEVICTLVNGERYKLAR